LETTLAEFWPEFAQSGKENLTLEQVMTHRAGLFALDDPSASLLDRESVVRAIEHQRPQIPPHAGPAYTPRVFGFLLDEIVRRLAGGESLGARWRRVFAEPLGLDFWIGLPESEHHRVATMLAPKPGPPAKADELFIKAFAVIDSKGKRVDNKDLEQESFDESHLYATVPTLPPDTYTVRYRVVSIDTHIVTGKFQFTIKAP
jgi:CubicO group peptidase (beta-lactamase class C family)